MVREPVALEVGSRLFPQQSASDQGRVAQMVGHDGRDVPNQSASTMLDYPPGFEQQALSRDLMVLGNAPQTVQWGDRTVPVAVNPFWSPERKAYERMEVEWQRHVMVQDGSMGCGQVQMAERPSHLELQPPQQGFQGNRPQGSNPETPQKGVEMDPIELFRLRCLREAEEKFRVGVEQMTQQQTKGKGDRDGSKMVDTVQDVSSQASYASAVSHGVASLGFTPPPPPGPPPATPPRDGSCSFMVDGGSQPPPPPPPHYPPVPPMPGFDGSPKRSGFLGENPTENLRTCELPRLVSDSTPLQFGDWWNMIDSHMGDLSYSSNVWWSMVKGSVERCYKEWLTCEPVARLRLRPQLDPTAHHWPRTERRALAMLLQAIPETIRDDAVASRNCSNC